MQFGTKEFIALMAIIIVVCVVLNAAIGKTAPIPRIQSNHEFGTQMCVIIRSVFKRC